MKIVMWNPPCKRCRNRVGKTCGLLGPIGLLDPLLVWILGCTWYEPTMDLFTGEYK